MYFLAYPFRHFGWMSVKKIIHAPEPFQSVSKVFLKLMIHSYAVSLCPCVDVDCPNESYPLSHINK